MPAEEFINKYCVNPDIEAMKNHRAEVFIDGRAYFNAIQREIDDLCGSMKPNRFFYMTAWWLELSDFQGTLRINNEWDYNADFSGFRVNNSPPTFAERLKRMDDSGVDIRVLPWVLPFIANELVANAAGMKDVNFPTLISVWDLRKNIRLGGYSNVAALNLLAHTFGSAHCKIIICGDNDSMRAYTSGLDPEQSRLVPPGLSSNKVIMASLGAYTAKSNDELNMVLDDLDNKNLPVVIYDVCGPLSNLPGYNTFVRQENSYRRIDVRRYRKEWQLTLGADINNVDIYYLKQQEPLKIGIYRWPQGGWHDVGVKVEGRAAGAIYDFFKAMWDEHLKREVEKFKIEIDKESNEIISHGTGWPVLLEPQPSDLPADTGRQYIQVLRTIPQMNFNLPWKERGKLLMPDGFKPIKVGIKGHRIKLHPEDLAIPAGAYASISSGYERKPLSFAPKGCFEFKEALEKAISAAESYIFIADQSLYAMEVMDWIHERMKARPTLKVILFYGSDPADPPNEFLSVAINEHLLRLNQTTIPKDQHGEPRNIVFWEWISNVVHCKVTIIDDVWCAIGSANCMRRSLYTDIELSVSILEPPTLDNKLPSTPEAEADPSNYGKEEPSFVQDFRRKLWAHYCGIPLDPIERDPQQNTAYTKLLFLKTALPIWNPGQWPLFLGAIPLTLRPEISRQILNPFPVPDNLDKDKFDKDYYRADPDSRLNF